MTQPQTALDTAAAALFTLAHIVLNEGQQAARRWIKTEYPEVAEAIDAARPELAPAHGQQ